MSDRGKVMARERLAEEIADAINARIGYLATDPIGECETLRALAKQRTYLVDTIVDRLVARWTIIERSRPQRTL